MNKTLSFVKLDFFIIKPYVKSIIYLIIMALIFGIFFREPGSAMSILMVYLCLMISYPFSIGEKNHANSLYGILPVDRKIIVSARYIYAIFIGLTGAFISIIFSFIISKIFNKAFILEEIFFTLSILILIYCFLVAFQFPIYFKLGYDKAKMLGVLPLLIISFGVLFLTTFSKNIEMTAFINNLNLLIQGNFALLSIIFLVIGIAILILSCFISLKIYKNKELM